MSSYIFCCGMCRYFNLYDKYGKYSKSFKCTLFNHYRECDEKACSKYEHDSRRIFSDVDKARENRL